MTLLVGDCREVLASFDADSIDAVVTDPPYGLNFMSKEWDRPDAAPIDADFANWLAGFIDGEGCFSVHKKNVNGFETFDCQFSISLRADDKPVILEIQQRLGGIGSVADRPAREGNAKATVRYCISSQHDCALLREILTVFPMRAKKRRDFEAWSHALDCWLQHKPGDWADMAYYRDALMAVKRYGSTYSPELLWHYRWARATYRVLKPGGRLLAFGGSRTHHRIWCAIEDAGFVLEDTVMWLYGSGFPKHKSKLKPAFEPICIARKGGVSELNIDAARIGTESTVRPMGRLMTSAGLAGGGYGAGQRTGREERAGMGGSDAGRWPANIVLDQDAADALDQQSGEQKSGIAVQRNGGGQQIGNVTYAGTRAGLVRPDAGYGDTGGASRFFYCAKSDRSEREFGLEGIARRPGGSNAKGFTDDVARGQDRNKPVANHHPTVKPVDLMRWLVRLVTLPGQTVLDPFTGSGTTGVACVAEGRQFIGIEQNAEYADIARRRIAAQQPTLELGA